MSFCIEKNYRNNEALRASFNRLAENLLALISILIAFFIITIKQIADSATWKNVENKEL